MAFAWLDAPSTAESASWTGAVTPVGTDRARRAASVAASLPSAPPDGCYRCHQEICITFFFDGFGHDVSRDGERLSNIGRLYNAHEETNQQTGIYKLYFEGMGRLLSDNPVGVPKTLGRTRWIKLGAS